MQGMTPAQRVIRISQLSFPVIGAMLSQSLMGIVDTAIVGHLGTEALAAVGAGNFAIYFCLALIAGLATAVQTQVSRYYGKYGRSHQKLLIPLITGFMLTVLLVIPLMLVLLSCSQHILMLVTPSISSAYSANGYFSIRLLALPAAALSLSFRGFWNGLHQAGVFLRLLLISHILNAVLSIILVFGWFGLPAMGIKGAATGTLIAMYVGVVLNIIVLHRWNRAEKICWCLPALRQIKQCFRLAFPDSLQQSLFALGMLAFYGLLAQLGEGAMAVGFIISNLTIFLILIGISFGIASASLVGRDLGAGNIKEAYQWGWFASSVCFTVLLVSALPLLFFPTIWIAMLSGGNMAITQTGSVPLQVAAVSIIADSVSLVLSQTLLSTGMTKQVLIVRASTLWLLGLPLCLLSVHFGCGLIMLWVIQTFQRFCASLWLAYYWKKQTWSNIAI